MEATIPTIKVRAIILQLESENKDRKIAIDDKDCSRYNRRVLNSRYCVIENVIKNLKKILE